MRIPTAFDGQTPTTSKVGSPNSEGAHSGVFLPTPISKKSIKSLARPGAVVQVGAGA